MYKRIMRWGAFCSHTLLHVHTIYMIVTSRVSSHSSLIHAFHSAIKMPNQACSYLIQAVGRCIMNRPRLMFQSIASKLPPLALQVSIWSFALTEIDLFFLTDARCSCPDMLEVLIMRGEWHHFQLASRLLRVDLSAPSYFQVLIPKVNEAVCFVWKICSLAPTDPIQRLKTQFATGFVSCVFCIIVHWLKRMMNRINK